MLQMAKYLLFKTASFALTLTLYGVFGVICAFIWLAWPDGAKNAVQAEESSKLSDFLSSEGSGSMFFTFGEMDGGAAHIINEGSESSGARPMVPSFGSGTKGVLARIPFYGRFPWGYVELSAVFEFENSGEGFSLLDSRLGRARLPGIAGREFCASILAHYKGFISKYGVSAISVESGDGGVTISKGK